MERTSNAPKFPLNDGMMSALIGPLLPGSSRLSSSQPFQHRATLPLSSAAIFFPSRRPPRHHERCFDQGQTNGEPPAGESRCSRARGGNSSASGDSVPPAARTKLRWPRPLLPAPKPGACEPDARTRSDFPHEQASSYRPSAAKQPTVACHAPGACAAPMDASVLVNRSPRNPFFRWPQWNPICTRVGSEAMFSSSRISVTSCLESPSPPAPAAEGRRIRSRSRSFFLSSDPHKKLYRPFQNLLMQIGISPKERLDLP